jgi:hypothetical protein
METKIIEKVDQFNKQFAELIKPKEIEQIYGSSELLEEQCDNYCRRDGNCRRDKSEELGDLIF